MNPVFACISTILICNIVMCAYMYKQIKNIEETRDSSSSLYHIIRAVESFIVISSFIILILCMITKNKTLGFLSVISISSSILLFMKYGACNSEKEIAKYITIYIVFLVVLFVYAVWMSRGRTNDIRNDIEIEQPVHRRKMFKDVIKESDEYYDLLTNGYSMIIGRDGEVDKLINRHTKDTYSVL